VGLKSEVNLNCIAAKLRPSQRYSKRRE